VHRVDADAYDIGAFAEVHALSILDDLVDISTVGSRLGIKDATHSEDHIVGGQLALLLRQVRGWVVVDPPHVVAHTEHPGESVVRDAPLQGELRNDSCVWSVFKVGEAQKKRLITLDRYAVCGKGRSMVGGSVRRFQFSSEDSLSCVAQEPIHTVKAANNSINVCALFLFIGSALPVIPALLLVRSPDRLALPPGN